ncbi:MAG: hypothetical protein K1X88_26580 [Nannocystaceae bacterium]|nr:hypothetical protein [Nannocystaceae bacterium]
MELIDPGTEFSAESLRVGNQTGGLLRIEQRITDLPHGDLYRARFGAHTVLVTYVDPVMAAQADVRAWLLRNVARAAALEHRNLLPQHGHVVNGHRLFLVQGNPEGQSARQLVAERAARGRAIDRDAAQTIVGHVCNALTALHQVMVHGFVTLDSVWISTTGRVTLAEPGIGALLTRTRRFERLRTTGRLPQLTPEHLLAPPQLAPGSDVFGVAALLLELLTLHPLPDAGTPLSNLGLFGPADLVLCLERATAPDVGARPPDVLTFKAELSEAMAAGPIDLRTAGPMPGRVQPSIADPRLHTGLPAGAPAPTAGAPAMPAGAVPMAMPPGAAMPMPPGAAMPMPPGAAMPMPPGAAMPMAMPMQAPQATAMLPAGFAPMGVVGVPMQGPGGAPTVVPVLVGVPMQAMPMQAMPMQAMPMPAPAAAPRPRPTASPEAMAELDRATRRIAQSAPRDGVLELTEDVSQSATRLASEGAAASASALRLDLASVEEAAERLETVDGEHAPEMIERDPSNPPTESGSFFGSFGGALEHAPGPDSVDRVRRGTIALDDDDVEDQARSYQIVRDGRVGHEHSLAELVTAVRHGDLIATDTLVHPLTQRRLKVIDVPELRVELGRAQGAPPPVIAAPIAAPIAEPIAQRPMMTVTGRSHAAGTLLWVGLAIAAFAGVGVWLWLQSSG